MHAAKIRTWLTGGIVLALIILVGAWFLMISPVRAATAELNDQAQEQEEMNQAEAKRIAVLAAQFEQIDDFKADLADLRKQLPQAPEHSEFQRQIAKLAGKRDVTISTVSVSASSELRGESIAPPAPAEGAEPAEGEDEETTAPAAPTSQFQDLHLVPVAIEVQGSYRNAIDFAADLQTVNPRLFLVLGLSGDALEATDAASGLPASSAGDLQLVISGQMYVMADGEPVTWTDEDLTIEIPAPSKGTNPMLGG